MTALLAVVGSAVALAFIFVLGAIAVRVLRLQQPVSEVTGESPLIGVRARLDAVEMKVDALPSLWEHERQVATDAKEHATKQRRAAAQALSDLERRGGAGGEARDPDEDDEAGRLLAEHAGGGDPQGVLPLHPDVVADSQSDLAERAQAVGIGPYL